MSICIPHIILNWNLLEFTLGSFITRHMKLFLLGSHSGPCLPLMHKFMIVWHMISFLLNSSHTYYQVLPIKMSIYIIYPMKLIRKNTAACITLLFNKNNSVTHLIKIFLMSVINRNINLLSIQTNENCESW